ncbi:MAG: c-type cytochrome [Candidatus Coatesbacteria bacterium]
MTQWHAAYREHYAKLKREGVPFFPDVVFKDAVVVVLLFAALCTLAVVKGAPLEELADPTDAMYNPRPEWYFLFLFQALKFFPGYLEAVAAVVLPGVGIAALVLLPFLDRGPERHPLDRPVMLAGGLAVLAGIAWLTVVGARAPSTNPEAERNPLVAQGQRLYEELKCGNCHTIRGRGGLVGPELSTIASYRDAAWLKRHFSQPWKLVPGSEMPAYNLLPDEADALVALLQHLAGGGAYTPRAPVLFEASCATCHALHGKGGGGGPDLSEVGKYRELEWVRAYIADPKTRNPDATMPGFKGDLADSAIEDISRYVTSQRGMSGAAEGKRLYGRLGCAHCHAIRGNGGRVGPDLAAGAARREVDWLKRHFERPRAVVPGSRMPSFNLQPGQVEALADYLHSFGGSGAVSPQARELFDLHCVTCHNLDGSGGKAGPDLSGIGLRREVIWLTAYLGDPKYIYPTTVMPSFKGTLTAPQIEDIARFLSTQRKPSVRKSDGGQPD